MAAYQGGQKNRNGKTIAVLFCHVSTSGVSEVTPSLKCYQVCARCIKGGVNIMDHEVVPCQRVFSHGYTSMVQFLKNASWKSLGA